MTKPVRSMGLLVTSVWLAGVMGFAQSEGEAIYKANCQSCHGRAGTPNPGIAKALDLKAASEYRSRENDQIEAVRNGQGKMKSFSGRLSDREIKDAVEYFRTLK